MGSPTIFKGSFVKQLKDSLEFFTARTGSNVKFITNSTIDPTATAVDALAGSMLLDQSGNAYLKMDDGNTTNWILMPNNKSLDIWHQEEFIQTAAADFSTGNNASFLGGGVLNGTLADETAAPLSGFRSLEYTMGGASTNDYFASPVIDIDPVVRGNEQSANLYCTYDGDSGDVKFVVYDVTNAAVIDESLLIQEQANSTRYGVTFSVPSTCTQIQYGFQVVVGNSGAVLTVDNLEFTSDPFNIQSFTKVEHGHWKVVNGSGGTGSTDTKIVHFGVENYNDISELGTLVNNSTNGWSFTAAVNCEVNLVGGVAWAGGGAYIGVSKNASATTTDLISLADAETLAIDYSSGDNVEGFGFNGKLVPGDVIRIHTSGSPTLSTNEGYLTMSVHADNEAIVTPAKSSLTGWQSYTPTFNGLGTVTGIEMFWRRVGDSVEINGRFACGVPSAAEARIGLPTGLTSAGTDKIDSTLMLCGHFDYDVASTGSRNLYIEPSVTYMTLGIMTAGTPGLTKQNGSTILSSADEVSVHARVPIADFVASPNFLVATPADKVAYVKDVKANATDGGGFTSGSTQTRDLNTLEGETSFASVASNQVTLAAGTYDFIGWAPAYKVDTHRATLYNVTDSAVELQGKNARSDGSDNCMTEAVVAGSFSIDSAKTFEIRHECQTTRAADGFGLATSFSDGDEVYTIAKITKVR